MQAESSGPETMRIMGIDPGSHVTGCGIVDVERSGLTGVLYEEIRPRRQSMLSRAMIEIHGRIVEIIREMKPSAVAVESIFFGRNARSLIRQGHVRGVVILAGAQCGVPLFEYSPLEVKQAVVGYGRAEKAQVQRMVQAILRLSQAPGEDEADALAVAICHAHSRKGTPL